MYVWLVLDQRRHDLDDKRKAYELQVKMPGLPPQVKTLPKNEKFSIKYDLIVGWKVAKLELSQKLAEICPAHWKSIEDVKSIYVGAFSTPSDLER